MSDFVFGTTSIMRFIFMEWESVYVTVNIQRCTAKHQNEKRGEFQQN